MKLAILQADHIPEHRHHVSGGNYPNMFANLFLKISAVVDLAVFDVTAQQYPESWADFDGFIITGSKAACFDKAPWIELLIDKIHEILQANKKIVGICFGHQILARALGGKVERAEHWGVGVHCVQIIKQMPWMMPFYDHLSLTFYHQDQVKALPESVELVATNAFCPVQMFVFNNQAWGIQAHPEMLRAHNHLLLQERKNLLEQHFSPAIDSLRIRDHGGVVGQWMINFFEME
ncbi:glutamine amidotransferase-related protein [Facilibium subflavum]|uniref:glutamine amidotransferase-related protein n=1 Tax=Facilibium subflavum TaxID=2219058 RepID=UPI000E655B76|nr:gamma-glutamyl-gamma-aminobutyrate hydrolase family protein [Facilibium subflavum]